ncbi:MAG: hypoxanthine phosphoribosyltransferase [Prevotella sp.]|jgi:hypoxanthine phosphoribosyltransferase|nr:hypoxanthine phosphoribosyltransferase [Prevotella sp.]MEE1120730.1 hypoxanthine phosphoribosyltransferase [Prevotella sp.]
MKNIKLYDKVFRMSLPEEEIINRVKVVAEQINEEYKGRRPLFLSVLNGAFMFTSDLMKEINIECEISFVKLASYQGTMSTGKVHEVIGINEDLSGRDIIIVEDIVESGKTIMQMMDSLSNRQPASIKVCTLFFKPSKLEEKINVDYAAIVIPDDFIVGYGLDYNQLGRNLRDIYTITDEAE